MRAKIIKTFHFLSCFSVLGMPLWREARTGDERAPANVTPLWLVSILLWASNISIPEGKMRHTVGFLKWVFHCQIAGGYLHHCMPILQMWRGLPRHIRTSAHDWGQVLTFEGQICSHFRAFTSCTFALVNDLKVRRNQPEGSN